LGKVDTEIPRDSKGRFLKGFTSPRRGILGGKYVDTETLKRLYCDEGLSINEIADKFGISYFVVWCRLRRDGISLRSRVEALRIKRKISLEPTKTLCYILGVLFGDGSAFWEKSKYYGKRGIVKLAVKDKKFAQAFHESLRQIGLNPSSLYLDRGCWVTRAISWKFVTWFKQLTLDDVRKMLGERERKLALIRGFYESEGCLSVNGKKRWIRFSNTDVNIMNLVISLLEQLEYHPKVLFFKKRKPNYRDSYEIRLYRAKEVTRFLNEVAPCIKC
jgi:intein-encoded DNA endonuclease-like protein